MGFYKTGTKRRSITWPQAVDEALCVGWIDGVRKRIDDESYTVRFTPRKLGSTWSVVNINRFEDLQRQNRVNPAGSAAFAARTQEKSGTYSYEQQTTIEFDDEHVQQFRANPRAWDFFNSQPAHYRRAATWWVVSAKREETRGRRLATLIEDSEQGRTVAPLTRRRPAD